VDVFLYCNRKFYFIPSMQVGTHADSLIAEAVLKNITGFDRDLAWEAVWKDATTPPMNDWSVS
jgi:putative alpha-1,2-mannosidase